MNSIIHSFHLRFDASIIFGSWLMGEWKKEVKGLPQTAVYSGTLLIIVLYRASVKH